MIYFKYPVNTYNDEIYFNGNDNVVVRLLKYILNPKKTGDDLFGVRGVSGNIYQIESQYYTTQILFNKTKGEKLSHLIISFPDILNIDKSYVKYAADIIADYIGKTHQLVYAVHINARNDLHIHFIINSVSYINGEYYKENTTNIKNYYYLLSCAFGQIFSGFNFGGYNYYLGKEHLPD